MDQNIEIVPPSGERNVATEASGNVLERQMRRLGEYVKSGEWEKRGVPSGLFMLASAAGLAYLSHLVFTVPTEQIAQGLATRFGTATPPFDPRLFADTLGIGYAAGAAILGTSVTIALEDVYSNFVNFIRSPSSGK